MTAPVEVGRTAGITPLQISLADVDHTIDLPAGTAGDQLLAWVAYVDQAPVNELDWPGWTRLGRTNYGVVDGWFEVWSRVADGSELATSDATTSFPAHLTFHVRRFSGATGDVAIGAFETNGTGDPPSLTSGFGSADTRWIAAVVYGSGDRHLTGFPAGYGATEDESPGDLAIPGIGTATIATTASSEDPTAFTLSSTSWISSVTVGILGGTPSIDPDGPPPYIAPEPSNAVLEIRVAGVGSSRWGVALWGVGTWSSAGWVDVTPQGVSATVRWGSHSPERGILTEMEPASWLVDTYDPDRLLDPGNTASPYHADLRAGLPLRIRHRGVIVRQGICEIIAYDYADHAGSIRVTDNISTMARSKVPDDLGLSDTLRARARDAIAGAGLAITVEPDPPSGDPALAPQREGEFSVWSIIRDAAEQTLHVPFVDAVGTLMFRPWASPYDRARGVDQRNLVDLGSLASTSGLYSVVRAQQTVADGGLLLERRLTPVPRYGPVVYERTDETPDAGAWADAVLADRSLQTVQWIPGQIWPLTADDVEYYARLQAMERFGITVPTVDVTGIIVGGEFRVTSKKQSAALWSFELELAQTADAPLYVDGAEPPEWLLNETSDAYLYPG